MNLWEYHKDKEKELVRCMDCDKDQNETIFKLGRCDDGRGNTVCLYICHDCARRHGISVSWKDETICWKCEDSTKDEELWEDPGDDSIYIHCSCAMNTEVDDDGYPKGEI